MHDIRGRDLHAYYILNGRNFLSKQKSSLQELKIKLTLKYNNLVSGKAFVSLNKNIYVMFLVKPGLLLNAFPFCVGFALVHTFFAHTQLKLFRPKLIHSAHKMIYNTASSYQT